MQLEQCAFYISPTIRYGGCSHLRVRHLMLHPPYSLISSLLSTPNPSLFSLILFFTFFRSGLLINRGKIRFFSSVSNQNFRSNAGMKKKKKKKGVTNFELSWFSFPSVYIVFWDVFRWHLQLGTSSPTNLDNYMLIWSIVYSSKRLEDLHVLVVLN